MFLIHFTQTLILFQQLHVIQSVWVHSYPCRSWRFRLFFSISLSWKAGPLGLPPYQTQRFLHPHFLCRSDPGLRGASLTSLCFLSNSLNALSVFALSAACISYLMSIPALPTGGMGVSSPAQPSVLPLSDVNASIADWVVGVSRPAQPSVLFQCAIHPLLQKLLHVPDNLPLELDSLDNSVQPTYLLTYCSLVQCGLHTKLKRVTLHPAD